MMVFLSEVGQRGTTPDIIPFPANGEAVKLNKVLSPIFISLHQVVHADGSAAGPFSRWKLPVPARYNPPPPPGAVICRQKKITTIFSDLTKDE
jgi:hypothetical protein